MTQSAHKSVLIAEVLTYLKPTPGKTYLDVTFGAGGHTRAILEQEPNCHVIALDWDMESLETYGHALQFEFPGRITLLWGNFGNLYKILKKARIQSVDGILADFGTSQMQINERAGFSFSRDTKLDMRMSPSHYKITAEELINKSSEEKLREMFWQLGEENNARRIVAAIVEARKKERIRTTGQLAKIIEDTVPRAGSKIHPATKVFQALRIFVNQELENIQAFLAGAFAVLHPEGRLVCISFHSLEDRLVKQFFKEKVDLLKGELLTTKAVIATPEEISKNSSSRSAKLRALKKAA